jgi:fused signal recognition particle receptor
MFKRLKKTLAKSSAYLANKVSGLVHNKKLDAETLETLEEILIEADFGPRLATDLVGRLRKTRFNQTLSAHEIQAFLADEIEKILANHVMPLVIEPHKPHVIVMIGVNGSGKTTTIGKLAAQFRREGKQVVIGAADTFRAAAVDQLAVWAERVGCDIVTGKQGQDAASVAYEAVETGAANGVDVVLIDTAGRLQNKQNLMDELSKIKRVLGKLNPDAPHDTLLVVDGTAGQNVLSQGEAFLKTADVTGFVVTKLDGTTKGGACVALVDKFQCPIVAFGVGEKLEDLAPFTAKEFALSLAHSDAMAEEMDLSV